MARPWRALCHLLAGAALLVARPAAAEEPRVAALSWIRMPGAEACATPPDVAQAVEQRLERRVFVSPTDAELWVEGRVEHTETGWQAVIGMMDADGAEIGTRTIEVDDPDCRALDASVALVVSAMIDPEAALRASATPETQAAAEAAPEPPAESAEVLERPLSDCPEPAPEPRAPPARWGLGIVGGGVVGLGVLPGVALGATLHIDVTPPGFVPIELGVVIFRDARGELRDGGGADLSLAWGELGLCPEIGAGETEAGWLRACGLVQVGAIQSRGFGFDRSFDSDDAIVNAAARARLALRLTGGLMLSAAGTLGVPLLRRGFEAREAGGEIREVFRMAAVLGLLEVGVGGEFF